MSSAPAHRDVGPPLFASFPRLASTLGWVPLVGAPTPVVPLPRVAEAAGGRTRILSKRDECAGVGGFKRRKLEFFIGEALRNGHRSILTFGAADSNHALATVACAAEFDLGVACVLTPAPPNERTRRHIRLMLGYGALLVASRARRLRTVEGRRAAAAATAALGRRLGPPFIVPFSGGGVLGSLGGVNLGFELRRQIDAGELPPPDRVYVALASMSTAAGLAVGLRLAGVRSRVVGVRVVDAHVATQSQARTLARRVARFLHDRDASIPIVDIGRSALVVEGGFAGAGYRAVTRAGRAARTFARRDGLALDDTYTAKTLAALLADARRCQDGEVLMLCNTTAVTPTTRRQAPAHAVPCALRCYL